MNLDCASCNSDNTQKLSLIVHSGTMENKSQTTGLGIASGGLGVGIGSTKGTSTSKLAKQYEEPEKMPVIRGFIAIMFFSLIAALFFGSSAIQIGFYIGIVAVIFSIFHNVKLYPKEHAEWDAKYICLKCSTVFDPKAHDLH